MPDTTRRPLPGRAYRRLLRAAVLAVAGSGIALALWCLIPLHSPIRPIEPRESTRYWTLGNGRRIAYTRIGAEGGSSLPPIVFLHGGPGAYVHSSTISVVGQLAALGRDVYLYDQAGSGLSDRLAIPSDNSFLGHIDDLHAIITAELPQGSGSGRVVLIGQSFGGRLAAYFAATHPELIDSLVLSSPEGISPVRFDAAGVDETIARYPVPPELRFTPPRVAPEDEPGLLSGLPLRAVASVVLATTLDMKLMSDAEADGVLNDMVARLTPGMVCDPRHVRAEEGGGGFYAHLKSTSYPRSLDPRARMAAMDARVLVLHGLCDGTVSYPMVYEYVDIFPNAEYRTIENAGHILWWDRPEAYVEAIGDFIRSGD